MFEIFINILIKFLSKNLNIDIKLIYLKNLYFHNTIIKKKKTI